MFVFNQHVFTVLEFLVLFSTVFNRLKLSVCAYEIKQDKTKRSRFHFPSIFVFFLCIDGSNVVEFCASQKL